MLLVSEADSGNYAVIQPDPVITYRTAREVVDYFTEATANPGDRVGYSFMFDTRQRQFLLSYYDTYQFASEVIGYINRLKQPRIAVLVDAGNRTLEFTAIIARDLGFSLRLFESEEDCKAWLDDSQEPPK